MGAGQTHCLEWRAGDLPISTLFDDPFFSLQDGLAETRHVFLAGNDLPARFCDGFHVAELGFGTGLNFLATLSAFRAAGVAGRLHFTSFEAFPLGADDLTRALGRHAGLPVAALAPLCAGGAWPAIIADEDFTLSLILDDARKTLPNWAGKADAWYLDGFSPAKNPELWQADLMDAVAAHTNRQGSFATYTAAGHVRRALAQAGFAVTRVAGYGRKRHMTRGVLAGGRCA